MADKEKIGVLLCSCSGNISNIIDFAKLKEFVKHLPRVSCVGEHKLLCSTEGKEFFKKAVNEKNLSRVLIVGCSPKQHETTFRKIAEETSLNPYLINMANIREQCAYVTENKEEAYDKAVKMINSSYKRLLIQNPLNKNEITVNPDVVVIGAGISGVETSLLLAQKNRKVHLIEKSPIIGGMVVRQEDVCPSMECATCLLEPKLDEVLHNDNIDVNFLSEVTEVKGFAGNFEVSYKKNPRFVDPLKCFGCGECFNVCPVEVKNEYNENMDNRKAIYVPFTGSLPFVATIDKENCLRFKGEECDKCAQSCAFDAVNYDEKEEEKTITAGAVVIATGHTPFNKLEYLSERIYGFNNEEEIKNRIFSSFEFERIVSQTGPTSGEIKLKDGNEPKSFVLVHCAGSRSHNLREYCSSVCCMAALKYNRIIKEKIPQAEVSHVYKELTLNNKYDMQFFNQKEKSTDFIRVQNIDDIKYIKKGDKISVKTEKKTVKGDMVILMCPMDSGRTNQVVSDILEISLDEYGFFKEDHSILNPIGTSLKGIYVVGTAQSPQNIPHSIAQAGDAAGEVSSLLIPGEKLELPAMVAEVDNDICSGCKNCIPLCPYKAISFDEEEQVAVISDVLCQACGVCVSSCPSKAITGKHFTYEQITTELEEVL